ncbi:type II toxin-antitoxin system HipA family toxin [Pseudovibrio sp. POLY-S9]|uniref:type II toxin-antitoxin system HipA family toxin n=1 Tax=Pseudovibrio sp. POLY-S9 TaxID=1576596 RepID=UPI00070B94B0|nr:type II toxin-antitoxin system HipA family toxin [Pseudovibrio sp. POLY-S9]
MSRILDVYLREEKAGRLVQAADASLTFTYDTDHLSKKNPSVSVSMPLREEPYSDATVRPFFSGLLPDERARKRLAAALRVSQENAFGLLEIIGGECAGALSLLPEDSAPPEFSSADTEPLSAEQLAKILEHLRERPLLGGEEGVRLSLAGAQDKLAVCMIDGEIALPKDGRPTTHILKPFIEGLEGTVENELFCMKLAARMGLNAPAVSKATAGETDFILVERYDRHQEKTGKILKLHQEDFCQALSVPPELKYEEEGGLGVTKSQELIQKYTRRPAAERLTFQKMLIFHYLVGNADAHAKNYSLLYREKTPDLAPLYDIVCTAAYPRLAKKMAMKIGGRALPDTIQLEHWYSLVSPTKAAQRMLKNELLAMASKIEFEADALLEELDEEGIYHPILKKVREIISKRVKLVQQAIEK